MANKKNNNNRKNNSHRHVYKKKTIRIEHVKDAVRTSTHSRSPALALKGSRIINLEKLQQYTSDLNEHSSSCEGSIVLCGETRNGLASALSAVCRICKKTINFETSKKVKGPQHYSRWECNLAAVWGHMSTGSGHSQLEESMSALGVPVMSKKSFVETERSIGERWSQELQEIMIEAGQEELQIAISKGSFHDGVPAITVIVDGGWSKRSHKHSYNAKSGVGIIIGKETEKLLYIGVRNKYCHGCSRKIPGHICYKNWNASLSEMETDIILEGFLEAERVHGLRYIRFVGDGDSSVHPTLIKNVPEWGHAIKKLECANHACKCYRGALERLVTKNPSYKRKGGLTIKMRKRLVSAARCAIRMRSKDPDTDNAVKSLRKDLLNGPYHCFGIHTNCSPDFCTTAKNHGNDFTSIGNNELEVQVQEQSQQTDECNVVEEIITDQELLWRETLADDNPQIEADIRQGGVSQTEIDQGLVLAIQKSLSRLVDKACQLIGNNTTNLAECWMHIRMKFDGGKVINRSQSGSWEHRCVGAGLRQNMGRTWGPDVWKKITQKSPNKIYSDTANRYAKNLERDRKRKATNDAKEKRRRSKFMRTDDTIAARKAYRRNDDGIIPDEVIDDVSTEQLKKTIDAYYNTKVVVNKDRAREIEQDTREQAESNEWMVQRRLRITASNTGTITKMRNSTSKSKKVQQLLYTNFRGNEATRHGIEKEDDTRDMYIANQRRNGHPELTVKPSGLCISLTNPWLAASPDGFVSDPSTTISLGLVEIKNPLSTWDKTLEEATKSCTFCLEHKDTIKLKIGHGYHYQIQCQMYCTDRDWCDFVLRTSKDIHIERIYRDKKWWGLQLAKLRKFYYTAMLPELACPVYKKGGIREPITY